MLKAFSGLDFAAEEVRGVMAMAAGVLSLGNLDFSGDGKEGSAVAGPAVADVARLWGVSEEALRRAVTVRTIEVRSSATETPLTTYCSLLTTYCSLLTAYYLLLTTYCSLLTAHCLLLTTYCSLLTAHYLLLTAYCSLLTAYC